MLTLNKITIAHTETATDFTKNDLLVLRATMNGNVKAANPEFLGESVKAVSEEMGISRQAARAELSAYVQFELEHEFAMPPQAVICASMGVYAQ